MPSLNEIQEEIKLTKELWKCFGYLDKQFLAITSKIDFDDGIFLIKLSNIFQPPLEPPRDLLFFKLFL